MTRGQVCIKRSSTTESSALIASSVMLPATQASEYVIQLVSKVGLAFGAIPKYGRILCCEALTPKRPCVHGRLSVAAKASAGPRTDTDRAPGPCISCVSRASQRGPEQRSISGQRWQPAHLETVPSAALAQRHTAKVHLWPCAATELWPNNALLVYCRVHIK